MFGTSSVHSPSADDGIPLIDIYSRVTVTRKSPPDGILLYSNPDSSLVKIQAQTIAEKKNWGGLLLPFFPLFWISKVNYYKHDPESLIVNFWLSPEEEATIISDSIKVLFKGQFISPAAVHFDEKKIGKGQVITIAKKNYPKNFQNEKQLLNTKSLSLKYNLNAHSLEQFELFPNGFYSGEKKLHFSVVKFVKSKQHWRFLGP